MSPRKMRIVANLVRGKRVDEAMAMLRGTPKRAGFIIRKLLISAVANAEGKGASDVDSLVVRGCSIDNGPILKRWMPRAMGRATRMNKKSSHVHVVLSDEAVKKAKKAAKTASEHMHKH